MRLVSDYHDVRPIADLSVRFSELVYRRENYSARRAIKQLAEMLATFCLYWVLSKESPAHGERAEQLVVEVVAVSNDDYRRIRQRVVTN